MQNHTDDKTSPHHIWQAILSQAEEAGLDPQKFTPAHRKIVNQIVTFLLTKPSKKSLHPQSKRSKVWLSTFLHRNQSEKTQPTWQSVPPIIICGEPGTGKTTFLYLLDIILRQAFDLPDNIETVMEKSNGRRHTLFKRAFNGTPISLLSVKKWSQLLHFYTWNVESHKLDLTAQDAFIEETLLPMRILFADEVEMTGYSPTIPDLARHGILVVGSSNQYEFQQLVDRAVPPHIYRFQGLDMRLGNPTDAIVGHQDRLEALFDRLQTEPVQRFEQLPYRLLKDEPITLLFDFQTAVEAPLLETDWIQFLQSFYSDKTHPGMVLLFDDFSLDLLKANYNAIIRFVSLFDAIEQLGLGVLVRNKKQPPQLSKTAITNLKTHVYNAIGVPEEVKQKTVVGLDRCASRLGQAGHKARAITKLESA